MAPDERHDPDREREIYEQQQERRQAERVAQAAVAVQFGQVLSALTPRTLVVPALVAINVGVWLLMVIRGVHFWSPGSQELLAWGANNAYKIQDGQWWRLASSMFIHGGLLHLGFNMYALWNIGRLVERLLGSVGLLVLYFVSGLVGSLASNMWMPGVVSVGASGAVFGVLGSIVGLLMRTRGTVPRAIANRLRVMALIFIGVNIYLGLSWAGIDNAAHVGGLVTGFLCGVLLGHPITPEAARGRLRRALLALLLGAAVIAGGVLALPRAIELRADAHMTPEMMARRNALTEFGRVDHELAETYNEALRQVRSGRKSEVELIRQVERELLPRWRKAHARFEAALGEEGATDDPRLRQVLRYAKLRQRGWELLVEALRTTDPALTEQAQQKLGEANEVLRKLGLADPVERQ